MMSSNTSKIAMEAAVDAEPAHIAHRAVAVLADLFEACADDHGAAMGPEQSALYREIAKAIRRQSEYVATRVGLERRVA
jgi:hypothetical protein